MRNGGLECGDESPLLLAGTRRGESSADESAVERAGASSRTPKFVGTRRGKGKGATFPDFKCASRRIWRGRAYAQPLGPKGDPHGPRLNSAEVPTRRARCPRRSKGIADRSMCRSSDSRLIGPPHTLAKVDSPSRDRVLPSPRNYLQ